MPDGTIQPLVTVKKDGGWQIELYQNTPAHLHSRPELALKLTEKLRHLLG